MVDSAHQADPHPGGHVGFAHLPLRWRRGQHPEDFTQPPVPAEISVAVALLSLRAGGQGLSLDTLKQAALPHINILFTTSLPCPGLTSYAVKLDGTQGAPNIMSYLLSAFIPQALGLVLFQGPFSTGALDPSKKGKGKALNISSVDLKPKDKVIFYKGKSPCRATSTSTREERPFVCSVYNNCFTTKGNLKGHFHQHSQSGYLKSSLWGLTPKDLTGGPLPSDLEPSPETKGGPTLPGMGPNHNSPRVGGFQGTRTPEPGTETLKLQQQLVEYIDMTIIDPNKCLVCHQKKFTSGVKLQQHIQTDMDSQITNLPLPEKSCDFMGPEPMMVDENGSTSAMYHDDVVESTSVVDEVSSQRPLVTPQRSPFFFLACSRHHPH
ncbi:Sal-like protein 4 [Plecturocebus cupreus]